MSPREESALQRVSAAVQALARQRTPEGKAQYSIVRIQMETIDHIRIEVSVTNVIGGVDIAVDGSKGKV